MIVVALPAFNEEDALPPLLDALGAVARSHRLDARVVVVNDGSSDRTHDRAGAADGIPVEVIDHPTNLGLGAAMRTGLRRAVDLFDGRATAPDDVVVTMDADNTHPPALIPSMLEAIRDGSERVVASRFCPGARVRGVSAARRLLAVAGGGVFRILLPMSGIRDYTCGYRMYRVDLLRRAYARYGDRLVTEAGFTCTADMLLKLRPLRPRATERPLDLRYDLKPGASKMRVARTMWRSLGLAVRRRAGRMD